MISQKIKSFGINSKKITQSAPIRLQGVMGLIQTFGNKETRYSTVQKFSFENENHKHGDSRVKFSLLIYTTSFLGVNLRKISS